MHAEGRETMAVGELCEEFILRVILPSGGFVKQEKEAARCI